MKIIYMGTPDFAVAPLQALIDKGYEVVLVLTQPDRERGRGREIVFSPVKQCAVDNNIPVFQPVKIKDEAAVAELKKYEADLFVVAAFGQILSKEILDMPRLGCINIHASLLPSYRGASPIQSVIMDGCKSSGVTIMQMDEGLDTGDIISVSEIMLDEKETADSLHDKLAALGASLLIDTLPSIEDGSAVRTKQNSELSNYAKMLSKSLGNIDFTKDALVIERLIRALNSWPSAYSRLNGKTLKIWEADVLLDNKGYAPGTIFDVNKKNFSIACGNGAILINSLQIEGKKRMDTESFLRGYKIEEGTVVPS